MVQIHPDHLLDLDVVDPILLTELIDQLLDIVTRVDLDGIGELVMEALLTVDKVAYIRFASVYRNFRETKDFEDFITGELGVEDD